MNGQNPIQSNKVSVNETNLYYEAYGSGEPLIFLHGYSLSSASWKPYVSAFDGDYKVYLIDLTGHGKSDAFTKDLSIKGVAKDLLALLNQLSLNKIKAVGFSFGGDVLYQLALLDPERIECMITIGAVGTWTVEDFPQYQEGFTFENRANFPWLSRMHQSDEQIIGILKQFKNYTIRLSDHELQQIQPEVLIMLGDDDEGMDFEEVARVKKHLPNSDLWVLPNVSHGAHEGDTKDDFVKNVNRFFNKKSAHDE